MKKLKNKNIPVSPECHAQICDIQYAKTTNTKRPTLKECIEECVKTAWEILYGGTK